MLFTRINNLIGWVVFSIAAAVYIMTAEAGGSLWDCGEFVSSCFKVQIPHPPGAPLFVIIGRVFIILFGDDPLTAAKAVNIMSAIASAFTILFLFWTITHFARKIMGLKTSETLTTSQMISVMGAGVVGALAYTFSDSFWYSAVEGEVYALSSFFTAIVFWAILKWENQADEADADKWIVFIFFMMGLSIGVHLLNLLTIPAIVMVYYFRKQDSFNYALIRKWFVRIIGVGGVLAFIGGLVVANAEVNPERGVEMDSTLGGVMLLGTIAAIGLLYLLESMDQGVKKTYGGIYIFFVIACAITGFVQVGVIQYTVKFAGTFDRIFKNDFGLPFFTGFATFFVLIAGLIWYGLKVAASKRWSMLRLGIWCLTFMLIGYSSYLTTMIRSSANPSVDMYNVDNPISLVGYLGREQYGDFPLLYGQKFTSRPIDVKTTGMRYQKSTDKYIELGEDRKYVFAAEDKMIFPRVWDMSNDQNHAYYYSKFLGINPLQDGTYERAPNQVDNIKYFFGYQLNWMYFRYFMWNFSGKQNDNQGFYAGNVRDGNWITGIWIIDFLLYGDQSTMPDSLKNNKANNKLFALPFILGLLGMFFHYRKKKADFGVNFLMFFFTGFAIVLYLNQAGYQPRERDYAYVGSFYAFAVWIGLGVLMIKELFVKAIAIEQTTAAVVATLVCILAVPALMASQEWDDHDRSNKVIARDLAKNYLESCAPNAILFTFGDNDTYPLWYAQEVEGIRKDIRVINYSLLGIDWYINQLRYKVNESPAIDVIWSADQIEGGKRDYIEYRPNASMPDDKFYNLYDVMKNYVGKENPDNDYSFPVKNVSVPVDVAAAIKNGTVNATESVLSSLDFSLPRNALMKNELAVLNIIAANNWKRPIYFTNAGAELGFDQFLRRDGLSYRLAPVKNSNVNTNWMLDKLTNKFAFGNADKPGVYFDEENRRHLGSIRAAYAELAIDLAAKNRKEEARAVLNKVDKMMHESNFGYGLTSRGNMHNKNSLLFLEACYLAEDKILIKKVGDAVKKDLLQQIEYYNKLPFVINLGFKKLYFRIDNMDDEKVEAEKYLRILGQMQTMYNPSVEIPGKVMSKDTSR
jgi:hypothetical protein